jgi:hypothetical protein
MDPFAAPDPGGGMADPFAAPPGAGGHADPFATAEPAFSPTATGRQRIGPSEGFLTQTDTSHQVIGASDTGRQLLDLPAHPEGEPSMGDEQPAAGTRELIELPTQTNGPPAPPRPVPTLASPSIARPAGRPADMGIPERRKLTTAHARAVQRHQRNPADLDRRLYAREQQQHLLPDLGLPDRVPGAVSELARFA